MAHNRTPLQVSEKFLAKLKELQRKVRMSTGDEKSLRELTEHLASSKAFEDLEKSISNKGINLDVNIRFDRRILK